MQELLLKRQTFTIKTTIGELYLPDGSFFSHTLEDTVRNHKIHGQTAIPAGRYEVIINWSNRFQRKMPRLINVPFYQGILIHWGNDENNTEGCILVGRKPTADYIYESIKTFDELFPKIRQMTDHGNLFMQIEGGRVYEEWTRL